VANGALEALQLALLSNDTGERGRFLDGRSHDLGQCVHAQPDNDTVHGSAQILYRRFLHCESNKGRRSRSSENAGGGQCPLHSATPATTQAITPTMHVSPLTSNVIPMASFG
jgi:hypothetical protein